MERYLRDQTLSLQSADLASEVALKRAHELGEVLGLANRCEEVIVVTLKAVADDSDLWRLLPGPGETAHGDSV